MTDDADFDAPSEVTKPLARPAKGPTGTERANAASRAPSGTSATPALTEDAPKSEILALVDTSPSDVLRNPERMAELVAHIKSEIAAFKPVLDTGAGRKAVASFAYRITRTKTALDDAGKALNEDLRKAINAVDATRRSMRDELDQLSDLARKPLTDWEAAEKERADRIAAINEQIGRRFGVLDTAADVKLMIDGLSSLEISEELLGDEAEKLEEARLEAVNDLVLVHESLRRAEEQAEENRRLKAELDERARQDEARAQEDRRRAAAEEQRKRDDEERASREAENEKRRQEVAEHNQQCAERAGEARGLFAAAADAPATAELLAKVEAVRTDGALVGPNNSNELSRAKELLVRRIRVDLAEEKAEADRKARVAADEVSRRHARTCVRDKLLELGAEHSMPKELANKLALAIINGEVPHLSINYEETT